MYVEQEKKISKKEIFEENIGLVYYVYREKISRKMKEKLKHENDDAIQEGKLGLIEASITVVKNEISNGRPKQLIDAVISILWIVYERKNQSMQDKQSRL